MRVDLAERGYDVVIGRGAVAELPAIVPKRARRAAVVTQPGIPVEVDCAIEQTVVEIERGERAKTMSTVEQLGRAFARMGLNREDLVVAVGGGVVTDVAGFAAASYHRGTAVVHVATTLLAQVDAAIGGKTGVNLPEGKNLMGAFWQPSGVICDTATLDSLPAEEMRSGLGEMAKYAFLGAADLGSLDLEEQVAECVALKAAIVASDERESGRRALLNYGHTLAHALEAASLAGDSGEVLRHGEAVAVGLVFAARLAERLGRIESGRVRQHESVVAGYGLPTRLPAGADPAELVALMERDKKARGTLTFVLDGPDGVGLVPGIPACQVEGLLGEMASESLGETRGQVAG